MKALTVYQPSAYLIATGQKPIETRTRRTKYRGPLLICAGKKLGPIPPGYKGPPVESLPRGVSLCVVNMDGCKGMRPEDWKAACCAPSHRTIGWKLSKPVLVEQVPITGQQTIFDVPDELVHPLNRSDRIASRPPDSPDLYTQSRP